MNLISLYLNKAIETNEEELPWATLRYLIGEAMYGGRVTDDNDRRVLNTYLKEFMGDFIFDTNQKFFFSTADYDYVIPYEADTKELIEAEVDKIPLFTNPAVFGLHSNAEIQYFSNSVKELWVNTLSMQTSEGGDAGGFNREDYIAKVATEIQDKLPDEFDIFNIKKKFDVPSPTQVVLLQELERFNILLILMRNSLLDLKRALVGEIGMSQALDDLANCIFNGMVPPEWLRFAPQSLKNLVNWFEHFLRRHKQYQAWDEVEEPKVIWLSGLQIPESYLTALVQTTCRGKGWALDKSTLYTIVTKEFDANSITKRLEHGTYVQGIYLEGSRWNIEKDCLDY
jgi:dynein heavy chain, axonemal